MLHLDKQYSPPTPIRLTLLQPDIFMSLLLLVLFPLYVDSQQFVRTVGVIKFQEAEVWYFTFGACRNQLKLAPI